ncbi:hypothetical protein PRIPAC_93445 [Pristionchus pacificus]|uniref:Uncharacterized protein n=1 Tax=Pristionchus pacificus TaxID=54126 RepID=A0A2A6BA77_PRIPA|nr:hypothetical protein PRIPAC_93445 [Pristionchus pacificus]|eukprot:PDM62778.1 hypothetical protein PRIPAC_49993 [Pristionchus pacificus]
MEHTSSGANESSIRKINMPIVISTLENPKSRCFRELRLLSCAKLLQICPISFSSFSHVPGKSILCAHVPFGSNYMLITPVNFIFH